MPECHATAITPDSKVGELLERWPSLEDVLVELSPHFRALRNPVLRKTVAKVATLRQVAVVGGVPLGVLVERLRSAVGLAPLAAKGEGEGEGGQTPATARPAWATEREAARTHDARAAIEAGEHPMPRVMTDLATLAEGSVYELVTPFVPAPLVDLARGKGFEAYSVVCGEGLVRTFFRRGAGAEEKPA
jgi:hypothetical protein